MQMKEVSGIKVICILTGAGVTQVYVCICWNCQVALIKSLHIIV